MQGTFQSLRKITHLHLPKWLSALAQGRTPRGCCRVIKGQLPWFRPPPAGWVRGVPRTEIELLQFHKRAPDRHPSAPPRLTLASSGLCLALLLIPFQSSCRESLFRLLTLRDTTPPSSLPLLFRRVGGEACKVSLWN